MEVSKEFGKYTEDDIKIAYEKAEEISVEMAVLRKTGTVGKEKTGIGKQAEKP